MEMLNKRDAVGQDHELLGFRKVLTEKQQKERLFIKQ